MTYIIVAAVTLVFTLASVAAFFALKKWYSRRKKKPRLAKSGGKSFRIEFSKLILGLVMLIYFLAVGVGIHLCYTDPTQFSTLAMLVGAPTAVGIGFYAWKAKAENIIKLKKESPEESGTMSFD